MELTESVGQLNSLYHTYLVMLKENPILATAVSIWGMATITFILWRLPRYITRQITRQLTTSMSLTVDGHATQQVIENFMRFHAYNPLYKWSRKLGIESKDWHGYGLSLGPGLGRHWLMHNGKLFWFTVKDLDSSGSERQKRRLVISTLGRKHLPLDNLLEDFKPKRPRREVNEQDLYIPINGKWTLLSHIPHRSMESVITRGALKADLIDAINSWRDNRSWYKRAGISHKLSIMLHGQPGTGKSSLVRALAGYLKYDLCMLDVSTVSYDQLLGLLTDFPRDAILLMEDIDAAKVTADRTVISGEDTGHAVNLSQLLNVLDGVLPLDNRIMFMTTNHLERLDPALRRKGRMDIIREVEPLDGRAVAEYLEVVGETPIPIDSLGELSVPGCELPSIAMAARTNPDAARDLLSAFRTHHNPY